MARRRLAAEPMSRLAVWARRLAVFALFASGLAVVMMQSGLLEVRPAIATFAGALLIAVIALLLAFAAFVVIWRDGNAGMPYALWAILIGSALLTYPGYLAVKAYRLPWLYDVTTDPIDPPRYEALARVRPRDANPIAYAGLYAAELQRAAYPDIETLVTEASPQIAYASVHDVVVKRRWRIVDERAPIAGRRDGHIEAVARTPIMGFRDDVVLRIRADGEGTRIDARSSSRYGPHDFGANAARIKSLMDAIEDAIGARTSERPEAPDTKPPSRPKRGQPAAKR
jgi:uncharacterized protein (DUF1499 family)